MFGTEKRRSRPGNRPRVPAFLDPERDEDPEENPYLAGMSREAEGEEESGILELPAPVRQARRGSRTSRRTPSRRGR